ncbi:putative ELL complex subunit Eap30 [Protomyces lactucae-debilis]|uniref:Vacuolar-sorting protein SNF8 n=1 Tax=Protomyces lactucae-debilis TaxID=2754530 RepID=A0A1Y2FL21_PROLT|nr:putative ELL complex subunit Eap30 [Protomyces lactucae-debilis]ORY83896.1 putative ELL complex subunit Eap30 [Protomyces lactucae-debilis]
MKKRAGLASFDKEETDARFKSVGNDMIKSQHVQLSNQLETFQQALAAFSSTHSAKIHANPEFRAEFTRMCNVVGIDPLSSSVPSGQADWTAELGLGAIYFDLAVQVVEVCRRTRPENGGIMSVDAATNVLNDKNKKFGAAEVGADDVVRAVQSLEILDSGFEVIHVGSKQMIRSVPKELNADQSTVLQAAQIVGYVSASMLRLNLGWQKERARSVLDDLVGSSMLWIDEQGREAEYWLPTNGIDG